MGFKLGDLLLNVPEGQDDDGRIFVPLSRNLQMLIWPDEFSNNAHVSKGTKKSWIVLGWHEIG